MELTFDVTREDRPERRDPKAPEVPGDDEGQAVQEFVVQQFVRILFADSKLGVGCTVKQITRWRTTPRWRIRWRTTPRTLHILVVTLWAANPLGGISNRLKTGRPHGVYKL
jgi:hypothetical protein